MWRILPDGRWLLPLVGEWIDRVPSWQTGRRRHASEISQRPEGCGSLGFALLQQMSRLKMKRR